MYDTEIVLNFDDTSTTPTGKGFAALEAGDRTTVALSAEGTCVGHLAQLMSPPPPVRGQVALQVYNSTATFESITVIESDALP